MPKDGSGGKYKGTGTSEEGQVKMGRHLLNSAMEALQPMRDLVKSKGIEFGFHAVGFGAQEGFKALEYMTRLPKSDQGHTLGHFHNSSLSLTDLATTFTAFSNSVTDSRTVSYTHLTLPTKRIV